MHEHIATDRRLRGRTQRHIPNCPPERDFPHAQNGVAFINRDYLTGNCQTHASSPSLFAPWHERRAEHAAHTQPAPRQCPRRSAESRRGYRPCTFRTPLTSLTSLYSAAPARRFENIRRLTTPGCPPTEEATPAPPPPRLRETHRPRRRPAPPP